MGCESNGEVILATGGYDYTVKIWNAKTGVNSRTYQHPNTQVNALEITPDKQIVAAAGYHQIFMYELNSKNPGPMTFFEGVQKNVTAIGFQEDGKWMYTGGEDMKARIWDLRSRSLHCQRIFELHAPVTCVRLLPNQREMVIGDQSGSIHIWDLNTDANNQIIPERNAIQDISIDPVGSYMAAINNKGRCFIWSLEQVSQSPTKFTPKHMIEAHSRYGLKCRFSPDGTLLVTTSADHTARVWRTADFSLLQEMKVDSQRWVWGAAFSLDSQLLVTASSDGMARLWDVATGTVKREYSGHQKAVTALAFVDQAVSPAPT